MLLIIPLKIVGYKLFTFLISLPRLKYATGRFSLMNLMTSSTLYPLKNIKYAATTCGARPIPAVQCT